MGQTVGWALNVHEYVFPDVRCSYDESHENLVAFSSGGDTQVPAMLVLPHWEQSRTQLETLGDRVSVCVIYFHPNAVDIGDCVGEMYNIRNGAFKGDAAVLVPEYSGYGLLSSFRPTVESIDIIGTAAWRYCRKSLGFQPEQIVLWGRSIGTGPASSLASRRASKGKGDAPRPVGAVVLVAPYISITEVVKWHTNMVIASLVSPMWEVSELVANEGLEDVPFCVVHPQNDEIIPFAHGQAVLESSASKEKFCLWIANATHNFPFEIEQFQMIRSFLSEHVVQQKKQQLGIRSSYLQPMPKSLSVKPAPPIAQDDNGHAEEDGEASSTVRIIRIPKRKSKSRPAISANSGEHRSLLMDSIPEVDEGTLSWNFAKLKSEEEEKDTEESASPKQSENAARNGQNASSSDEETAPAKQAPSPACDRWSRLTKALIIDMDTHARGETEDTEDSAEPASGGSEDTALYEQDTAVEFTGKDFREANPNEDSAVESTGKDFREANPNEVENEDPQQGYFFGMF